MKYLIAGYFYDLSLYEYSCANIYTLGTGAKKFE